MQCNTYFMYVLLYNGYRKMKGNEYETSDKRGIEKICQSIDV